MTLAHHSISQLDKVSDVVRDAVMMIPNKVVFGGIEEADAEALAKKLFLDTLNFEKPKKSLMKPSVVGYHLERLKSWSRSETSGRTSSTSSSVGSSLSESMTAGDEESLARAWSETQAEVDAEAHSTTTGLSEGESETYVPDIEWLPTQVETPEEQFLRAMVTLIQQPTQVAVVRQYMQQAVTVKTETIGEIAIGEQYVGECKQRAFARQSFVLPRVEAEKAIEDRHKKLKLLANPQEPVSHFE